MAEEVKKAPKPVDPNSAKYKLGKIAADAYVDAIEAKKRGEKVAWGCPAIIRRQKIRIKRSL